MLTWKELVKNSLEFFLNKISSAKDRKMAINQINITNNNNKCNHVNLLKRAVKLLRNTGNLNAQ